MTLKNITEVPQGKSPHATLQVEIARAKVVRFTEPLLNADGSYKHPKPCKLCGDQVPNGVFLDGKKHNVVRRSYCLTCSPLGAGKPLKLAKMAREAKTLTKFCHGCGQTKKFDQFCFSKTSGLQSQCRACHARLYADSVTTLIERGLLAIGRNACVACGYKGCADAMVFLDPSGKTIRGWELKDIGFQETPRFLKGCDPLCVRCAAERKSGMLAQSEFGRWTVGKFVLSPRTNQEVAAYALQPDRVWNSKSGVMHMAIAYKGGHCALCSYSRCGDALALHLDGNDFVPSAHFGKSWERIRRMIGKHTLLCVRCHAEVHRGYVPQPSTEAIDLTGKEFLADMGEFSQFGQQLGAAWTMGG